MNAIQFNSLAIVFILGILPFSVAFITNAGSSSDGEYEDSISSSYNPNFSFGGEWINNGGLNYTSHYYNLQSQGNYANRTYVLNEKCPAAVGTQYENDCELTTLGFFTQTGILPMNSKYFIQTHWPIGAGGGGNNPYVGASGDGPFTLAFNARFFSNLVNETGTLDKLKLDLVETAIDHNCGSSIFENITFDADLTIAMPNNSISFDGFTFEKNTKYEYEQYSVSHGGYLSVCNVGLVLEFDFTGFESIQIDSLIKGDWYNATIILNMDNFKRGDDNLPFTTEALPWAGVGSFSLGVQHQFIDPVQANFIIKTGTLFLAVGTFALAVASTPYWDPFRNFFKGMID